MEDLLSKVVSLCKRRGFVFQSSEIYGGLKSAYDFGPLGAELKRNIAQEWWKSMVTKRSDVVGIDAAIFMHPNVWKASGHLAGFSDPLVDCTNCKERFRADKAPQLPPGQSVSYLKGGKNGAEKLSGVVAECGYVCPQCSCPKLSDERMFNLMFRTSLGPVDPIDTAIAALENRALSKQEIRKILDEAVTSSAIYLRPETAQAMFVQFLNVQQTMSMKVPFGIAQQGKSFRNEITTEKFIFRTCEFEQMEMEYFVEPGTQKEWMKYWTEYRISWWQNLANRPSSFRLRQHAPDELAHYADDCYDIDYEYPWGWDELEGVASRTDYDLAKHTEASGIKLSYFDQQKNDPETGKPGWRYTPYVIEPAAGLTRGFLALMLDAYAEEKGVDADGAEKTRVVLKLHPRLAPYKVAILPLMKKEPIQQIAEKLSEKLLNSGIHCRLDEQQSIGKRYAKHDEIGTPYCVTVDPQSVEDGMVTIRDRDTTDQQRIPLEKVLEIVRERLER